MRARVAVAIAVVATALFFSGRVALADTPPIHANVSMTDSAASGLAGTNRVAITSVMVSFQTSSGDKTSTNGMFANKSDTSSLLQMPDMDPALLAQITDEIYAQLKSELQASGFEVLPEATVLASPAYQQIVRMAGISNFSKFANADGDILLVGASGLKPYHPYVAEGGVFNYPSNSHIKGWLSGLSGASSTPGGPTATSIARIYGLPGLEVALAKELNAHVVKATYVVTLGSAKAGISGRFSSYNHHEGSAFAQVGLRAGQSRIAFRTPGGKPKGQSVARTKPVPAKDGDVVVALADPLTGGTGFFSLAGGEQSGGLAGFLGVRGGADVQFAFTAKITDPDAYRAEVVGMVTTAQHDMLALLKH